MSAESRNSLSEIRDDSWTRQAFFIPKDITLDLKSNNWEKNLILRSNSNENYHLY